MRSSVKLGMQNACLRSFQNLVFYLALLRLASPSPPRTVPRPFPLRQRHQNVFVNRGTRIDAATRIAIRPGGCARSLARSKSLRLRKTDFPYRGIGSLKGTRNTTPWRAIGKASIFLPDSLDLHQRFCVKITFRYSACVILFYRTFIDLDFKVSCSDFFTKLSWMTYCSRMVLLTDHFTEWL